MSKLVIPFKRGTTEELDIDQLIIISRIDIDSCDDISIEDEAGFTLDCNDYPVVTSCNDCIIAMTNRTTLIQKIKKHNIERLRNV